MWVWHNTGQTRGWDWFTATKPVRAYLYGQPPYTTYQCLTYLTRVVWVDEPISEWMENWLTLVCTKRKPALHWLTNVWGNQKEGVTAVWRIGLILLSYLKNILSNLIVTSNGRDISSWHHTSVSTYLAWFNTIACSTHCSVDNLLFLLRRSSYRTRSPPLVASGWLAQIKMVDLHW